jgi:hypothetical protein
MLEAVSLSQQLFQVSYGLMLLLCYYHCVVRKVFNLWEHIPEVVGCPVML